MGVTTIDAVFDGGGVKGIALAGAAAGVLDSGYRFGRVAGTSAGALVAATVSAGYRPEELRRVICELDWPKLLDPTPLGRVPGIGKHLSMVVSKGMYRGNELERVWSRLLAEKGVTTFADVEPDSLRVVVTDLTHGRGAVLPDDLPVYGYHPEEFPIARAVRMSSAVPFVFRPVKLLDRVTGETVLMADGAMAAKFPVRVLQGSSGARLLGFRLVDTEEPHPHLRIRGPISLAAAVMSAGISARAALPAYYLNRSDVVDVPACRDPLDFSITSEDAGEMFDRGYTAAIQYLEESKVGVTC